MSDAPKPGAGPTPPQGEVPPQFLLNSQYVKDLSFENPNAPQALQQADPRPNITVNVNVEAKSLGPDVYEVELRLAASAKRDEAALFSANRTSLRLPLRRISASGHARLAKITLQIGDESLGPFQVGLRQQPLEVALITRVRLLERR